ncbi:MAG: hypothetical protein AAGI06_19730 [Pseudomonadota bacterium]
MPPLDPYATFSITPTSPGRRALSIDAQKDDVEELTHVVKAIRAGSDGIINAVKVGDTVSEAQAYPVTLGMYVLGPFRQVLDTGTTGTGHIGEYD